MTTRAQPLARRIKVRWIMPELTCAVCKTTERVRFHKAGNFTLPLCGNASACTERYERSRTTGSDPAGGVS